MKILNINTSDFGGGAERVAMYLHRSYRKLGHQSTMPVGYKRSDLPSVVEIPQTCWFQFWDKLDKKLVKSHVRGAYRLHQIVKKIKAPYQYCYQAKGIENYHFPQSRKVINHYLGQTDIIHFHNLHNQYFDLEMLPLLSKRKPVLITMHDEYLFTGHCAYTLGCGRWRTGCGECPHLDVYPAVKVDNTYYNWERKRKIFSDSDITLVTPSEWLANRVKSSILSHLPVRVIPNGINLDIFKSGSQSVIKDKLGLDQDAFVILYAAAGGRQSSFKDYEMLDRLIKRLQEQNFKQPVILLALGGGLDRRRERNNVTMIEKSFIKDSHEIAKYYQASDLYIHTAKADNAPLVILEAMACGKPIVATQAGGIPELVREGDTGYTIPIGNDEAMVAKILILMQNSELRKQMGLRAAEIAKSEYGLERMVKNYLNFYDEIFNGYNA